MFTEGPYKIFIGRPTEPNDLRGRKLSQVVHTELKYRDGPPDSKSKTWRKKKVESVDNDS